MTPTDPLAADDAIVVEAGKRAEMLLRVEMGGRREEQQLEICAIADKRGRALRETMAELGKHHRKRGAAMCWYCHSDNWPCPDAASLARIREILGGE